MKAHKAYNDRCAPYIRRIYEDIASNEWWIADNHTFDVIVVDKNGKQHRPYLTAFMDARSGILTRLLYYIQPQFRGHTNCTPERDSGIRHPG